MTKLASKMDPAELEKTRDANRRRRRAAYLADPEKHKARSRAWYASNNIHPWLGRSRMVFHGLTTAHLDAMLEEHRGRCGICGDAFEAGAANSNPRQMHVDHCHTTGVVRGLLCRDCNLGFGRFHDSATRLTGAVAYAQAHAAAPKFIWQELTQ